MTGPPSAPAAGGPDRPPPKSGRPEGKTVGRHELARHVRFTELSPALGVLDEEAMSRALADDPSAFELLALMTTATDERLRAAAIAYRQHAAQAAGGGEILRQPQSQGKSALTDRKQLRGIVGDLTRCIGYEPGVDDRGSQPVAANEQRSVGGNGRGPGRRSRHGLVVRLEQTHHQVRERVIAKIG